MRSVILIALMAVLLSAPVLAEPKLTYIINVRKDGNATITMVFEDTEAGTMYTFLPRFENYTLEVTGSYEVLNDSKYTYFYNNFSINYEPGDEGIFKMTINYEFPYASLIGGRKAWFMTPLIGAPNNVAVYVNLTLENFDYLSAAEPQPIVREDGYMSFRVFHAAMGRRVVVEYLLKNPAPKEKVEEVVNGTRIILNAPLIYKDLIKRISKVYKLTKPYLDDTFGVSFDILEFRIFLPKMLDIGTLGYVESLELTIRGPIYLSLGLLRYVPGYFETTIVHEYTHKALAKIGVEANNQIRWFHEGMAEYISLEICEKAGINVTYLKEDMEDSFKYLVKETGENFGFLQSWDEPINPGLYYAASAYIIKYLADRYGGLEYIERVVEEAKKMGKVTTNDHVVTILSRAAGEDLYPLFRKWGFVLLAEEPGLSGEGLPLGGGLRWLFTGLLIALVVITVLVVFKHFMASRERVLEEGLVRCRYCGAVVSEGTMFCPYCGREIELPEIGENVYEEGG